MKIAICLSTAGRAQETTTAMTEAQRAYASSQSRFLPFALGCVGVLGHPDESPEEWPLWVSSDGSFIVIAGVPTYGDGPNRSGLDAGSPLVRDVLANADTHVVRRHLATLEGVFVAVYWHVRDNELTICTDILGLQPLYRCATNEMTCLASTTRAFARAGVVPIEADAGAWGATIRFGSQVGSQTLLAGVERVASASMVVFSASGEVGRSHTWEFPPREDVLTGNALLDAFAEGIRNDLLAHAPIKPKAALLLSGGFDSRMIFAVCSALGASPRVLIQSHPDEHADADAVFAMAFARTLGISARAMRADPGFFGSNGYLWYLEQNEVATPTYQLFITLVTSAFRNERQGLWDGLLLGALCKTKLAPNFDEFLGRSVQNRASFLTAIRTVFAPQWADRMFASSDTSFASERSRFEDDADGVWRFNQANRLRFRTGAHSHQVHDSFTTVLTPGSSRELWEIAARGDLEARLRPDFNSLVLERIAPGATHLPLVSGSQFFSGSGGSWLYHRQRAMSKVQQFAQRPRIRGLLRNLGIPPAFEWSRSRFFNAALREVQLDDPRINADAVVRLRMKSGPPTLEDDAALELLMYWQAWHHVMEGALVFRMGRFARVTSPVGSGDQRTVAAGLRAVHLLSTPQFRNPQCP